MRGSRRGLAGFMLGAAILATPVIAAAPSSAAQVAPGGSTIPESATNCGSTTCIYVNGSGDTVNYVVVTNNSKTITGQCTISDTSDGNTYYGPTCGPGHTWRLNFYRTLKNNSKVCGSISGLDVRCLNITNNIIPITN
jgi:hypothetical protein